MYQIQQISALEKVRLTDRPNFREITESIVLPGERFSYQIACFGDEKLSFRIRMESPLAEYVKLYNVCHSPMDAPVWSKNADDDYITKEPGLMPDLLTPLANNNYMLQARETGANALWVRIDLPEDLAAGTYKVDILVDQISLYTMESQGPSEPETTVKTMTLKVLSAVLPKQTLKHTEWFYADCIAQAHGVEIYSEAHWALIDKYMACAVELGINMLLMPVITPPVDTMYGVQRPCVQLVEIEKTAGGYRFDFDKVRRWIALCKKNGIVNYEIAHLFSQWGMHYTPNVMVTENGTKSYRFGWHVPSTSEDYADLLRQLIPALRQVLREEGVEQNTYFHVSDEPNPKHFDTYQRVSGIIKPLVEGCHTIDALSHYEYYEAGLVEIPVANNLMIEPFLEHKLENQWVYYCCSEDYDVSNRSIAMPSYRTRVMGLQMYKFGIKGFLHWGFNYYNGHCSSYPIDPFRTTSGDCYYPSGDPFLVYPGPLMSVRAMVFYDGLQDMRVAQLLESLIGREAVVKLIDEEAGMDLRFSKYPRSADFLLNVRKKMMEKIEEAVK